MTRQQFERDWQFQHAVYERVRAKAEQHTHGEWDWERWEAVLAPAEFDTLLVLNFVSTWENNGRFIDTVAWYEDEFDRVGRAFRRLGFNIASVLMPRALELYVILDPYLKEDLPLPAEIGDEVERINKAASAEVSDERLTQAITARATEFSA